MEIKNLWEETMGFLEKEEKTWNDIKFIYGRSFQITKENFKDIARETNYDCEIFLSDIQNVATDLTLRGDDFVVIREALCDSNDEEWCLVELPETSKNKDNQHNIPEKIGVISRLARDYERGYTGWETLEWLQEELHDYDMYIDGECCRNMLRKSFSETKSIAFDYINCKHLNIHKFTLIDRATGEQIIIGDDEECKN